MGKKKKSIEIEQTIARRSLFRVPQICNAFDYQAQRRIQSGKLIEKSLETQTEGGGGGRWTAIGGGTKPTEKKIGGGDGSELGQLIYV